MKQKTLEPSDIEGIFRQMQKMKATIGFIYLYPKDLAHIRACMPTYVDYFAEGGEIESIDYDDGMKLYLMKKP